MWPYYAVGGIWLVIAAFWMIPVIRDRVYYEVFAALGVGAYFSLVPLMWIWEPRGIAPLTYIGIALIVLGCGLFITAIVTMRHRGAPESGWEETTKIVRSGIFRVVRNPVYLGGGISALGIVMLAQSIPATVIGLFSFFCFRLASVKEAAFNEKKFGDEYSRYMEEVPMWNFLKGLYHVHGSKNVRI